MLEFKIVEKFLGYAHIWPFRFYCEKKIQERFQYIFYILHLYSMHRHNPTRLWPQQVQKLPAVTERYFKEKLLRSITVL